MGSVKSNGRKKKRRNYLHYVPEFDTLVILEKRYKSFWRDAFLPPDTPRRLAKGRTPHVFLECNDFGFRTLKDAGPE